MENTEEVMQILERFTRLKQKEIPKELDEYLQYVAKTGDTVFKWPKLKYLFREKFLSVIKNFHDNSRVDDLPQYPNVDPFNYETLKAALLERLELFNAAPFTIQRLCELLIDPRKQYSRIDKYMRALEKNILVVSTVEPGRKRDGSENGDSLDSVVNGDISLDVNVDIDMENESLFNVDAKNKLPSQAPNQAQKTVQAQNSQQTSSNLVHKSDDEVLPNPKKQKMEDDKTAETDTTSLSEKTDKVEEAKLSTPISSKNENLAETSQQTKNPEKEDEVDDSKANDTTTENISKIPETAAPNEKENEKEELEKEDKNCIEESNQDSSEKKTEIKSQSNTEELKSDSAQVSNENLEETKNLTSEESDIIATDNKEQEKLDLEKKEENVEVDSDSMSKLADDGIKATSQKSLDEENKISDEAKTSSELDEKDTETAKEVEKEKLILKNDDITNYNDSSVPAINQECSDEIPVTQTNITESEIPVEIIEKNEQKEELEESIKIDELKEKQEDNVLEIEISPDAAVLSTGQTDQPMIEDNADVTTVTVNNMSLTIPDDSVAVDEIIMGETATEMATDPVDPIKDETASMDVDDTSQEAMDQ